MMDFVGIDVSKDHLDVCLLSGEQSVSGQFKNDKTGWKSLQNWLKKHTPRTKREAIFICLEATGRYGEGIAAHLHALGYRVCVVNPARIKAYAASRQVRNKTDALDAAVIADFCRAQHADLTFWTPPDPAQAKLQAMVRRLEDLLDIRQQEQNRLQAGEQTPVVLEQLQTHIAFLDAQIKSLKHDIDDHIGQHPHLKQQRDLIASITGIGTLTAAKLLGEIRDFAAFASPKALVAFAGLNPRQRVSGSSVRGKTSISKVGSAAIRKALYMCGVCAKKTNLLLRDFVKRLEQRQHSKQSIVVAVMRKLLHIIFGVLKSGRPFDPLFGQTQPSLA